MGTIDAIVQSAEGKVVLVMGLDAPLDLRAFQLRLHEYVGFALDGQLASLYPETVGRPIEIRVVVPHEPSADVADFFARTREAVAAYGPALVIEVQPTDRARATPRHPGDRGSVSDRARGAVGSSCASRGTLGQR